ncbi:MAG: hypothetical protein BWK77_01865 [Verrucomicrobia bacterium A1]|nr:MAG: hypothetical protein BWK77_01865 [Verrucomicrobia bacterium A1]
MSHDMRFSWRAALRRGRAECSRVARADRGKVGVPCFPVAHSSALQQPCVRPRMDRRIGIMAVAPARGMDSHDREE